MIERVGRWIGQVGVQEDERSSRIEQLLREPSHEIRRISASAALGRRVYEVDTDAVRRRPDRRCARYDVAVVVPDVQRARSDPLGDGGARRISRFAVPDSFAQRDGKVTRVSSSPVPATRRRPAG